jgi:hypothetical protein
MERGLPKCEELGRLRKNSAELFAQYSSLSDELKMIRKKHPDYARVATELKKVSDRFREAHRDFQNHIKEHKCR